jgi:hypothetical protein
MKGNFVSRVPALMMLASGIAALLLRIMLYRTAVDVKGLLLRNSPLEIAVIVLTAAVLLGIALIARKTENSCRYEDICSASLIAGIGHVAAGSGILVTVLTGTTMMGGYMEMIWRILMALVKSTSRMQLQFRSILQALKQVILSANLKQNKLKSL